MCAVGVAGSDDDGVDSVEDFGGEDGRGGRESGGYGDGAVPLGDGESEVKWAAASEKQWPGGLICRKQSPLVGFGCGER